MGRPSRSLSAKRNSSGFTCYLDGPEDDQALRDSPSPTLPMSPLQEVSDLARVVHTPSTDHFVPISGQNVEMDIFWKKVDWYVISEHLQWWAYSLCKQSNILSKCMKILV